MSYTKRVILTLTVMSLFPAAAMGQSIFHDPWLNWDFKNLTGTNTDDFEIIVENAAFNPNPNAVPPEVLMFSPYQNFGVTTGDFDGDGDQDAKLSWSNPAGGPILPNQVMHVGGDMRNSGPILDAYWTFGGNKVGNSIAISYELTEIRPTNSAEIHMQLNIAPGFYEDQPSEQGGWTNMRTFVNIPAGELGLADLNDSLDLDSALMLQYEVTPQYGQPGVPGSTGTDILLTDENLLNNGQVLDVYLATVDEAFLGPDYESLLYAEVLNAGTPIGQFWNLNPQSPEPGTALMLFSAGLMGLIGLGRRKRRA